MKINEVITEKERVDEVLPAIIGGAVRLAPYALRYGKKAWDYGKNFFNPDVAKKTKGALHLAGEIGKKVGPKVHAAAEVGKKMVRNSPADTSVPDALKTSKVGYGTGQVDPSLATAARQKLAVAGKGVKPKPPARGKMSPEAGAAIAQAQQAQGKRRRP